jgi:hypothetical protein
MLRRSHRKRKIKRNEKKIILKYDKTQINLHNDQQVRTNIIRTPIQGSLHFTIYSEYLNILLKRIFFKDIFDIIYEYFLDINVEYKIICMLKGINSVTYVINVNDITLLFIRNCSELYIIDNLRQVDIGLAEKNVILPFKILRTNSDSYLEFNFNIICLFNAFISVYGDINGYKQNIFIEEYYNYICECKYNPLKNTFILSRQSRIYSTYVTVDDIIVKTEIEIDVSDYIVIIKKIIEVFRIIWIY